MSKRIKGEWVESVPFTHKKFRPYAVALGEIALTWNDLHVSLSFIFCSLLGGGNIGPFQAVWQNILSDRMQRNSLIALAKQIYIFRPSHKKDNEDDDIKWLCDIATKMEDIRNDALHSPLWGLKRYEGLYVAPVTGLGHIRANKLLGKNLLSEFRRCRDTISALRNYAMLIDDAIKNNGTWPKRPKLPSPPPTKKTPLPIQTRKAKRVSPPQSSEA